MILTNKITKSLHIFKKQAPKLHVHVVHESIITGNNLTEMLLVSLLGLQRWTQNQAQESCKPKKWTESKLESNQIIFRERKGKKWTSCHSTIEVNIQEIWEIETKELKSKCLMHIKIREEKSPAWMIQIHQLRTAIKDFMTY